MEHQAQSHQQDIFQVAEVVVQVIQEVMVHLQVQEDQVVVEMEVQAVQE
tara:strand:+ start:245 stop:391 length:147 start_codon:yes stop_codon:yes gene_type:complete